MTIHDVKVTKRSDARYGRVLCSPRISRKPPLLPQQIKVHEEEYYEILHTEMTRHVDPSHHQTPAPWWAFSPPGEAVAQKKTRTRSHRASKCHAHTQTEGKRARLFNGSQSQKVHFHNARCDVSAYKKHWSVRSKRSGQLPSTTGVCTTGVLRAPEKQECGGWHGRLCGDVCTQEREQVRGKISPRRTHNTHAIR
jgi:hypothetical protein